MGLPGVNVGPLDPDATASFGQVSQHQSARQIVRLHRQMYPVALTRLLARPLDPERTKGLDLDEVEDYLAGQRHDNGDPLLPEGAAVVGASVRGEPRSGQVLTFTYRLASGRTGKWHAPYGPDVLPDSFEAGATLAQVREMKDRGVVAFDSEGTQAEILRRQNTELARENRALRKVAAGESDEIPSPAEVDTRDGENIASENERLGRENEEMRARLEQLEQLVAAQQGGGVNTAGADETASPDRGQRPRRTSRSRGMTR